MRPFALTLLAFLLLLALFGPHTSYIQLELKNSPPSLQFWFGTDELGRDLFSRICQGTRISLFIGLVAAALDMLIGILYGALAARFSLLMRLCDILQSIPYLLIVILLTVIRGPGITTLLIAMTLTGWINMARISRAQILQLLQKDYITAARALGASPARILFFHLIPNAMGPLIATATLTVPTAIFTEAFLSFLGLGIQAPAASLGVMLSDGLGALRYYPWRLFFPAAFITSIMLIFNVLGNSLRDALDPKLNNI